MDALKNLYSRKSIREFNGETLTQSELDEILKCAYASPIGLKRYDRLSMYVIRNKDLIARWEEETARVMGRDGYKAFYGAPVVILVCSEVDGEPYSNVNYSNAAIVVHNMAIGATALGLGACHIWSAPRALVGLKDVKREIGIKEGQKPCCAIALGRCNEVYEEREIEWNKIDTIFID